MRPGVLRHNDRVRHDVSGETGIIIRVFNKRGEKGIPVEYAQMCYDRTGDARDHPTITLTKI